MKRLFSVFMILCFLTFQAVPAHGAAVYKSSSPLSKLTKTDIRYLKATFKGTKSQLAQAIYDWQLKSMTYAFQDSGLTDANDFQRFNYTFPGIYPLKSMIREKRLDGRIYSDCYGFALLYKALADYYKVPCRVVNSRELFSESDPNAYENSIEKANGMSQADYVTLKKLTAKGISPEEYGRLAPLFKKNKVTLSHTAVGLVYGETPAHYRAEVYLNGKWTPMDASDRLVKDRYPEAPDLELTFIPADYLKTDRLKLAKAYQSKLNAGASPDSLSGETVVDRIQFARLLKKAEGTYTSYVGIVDDLGQSGRAATVDDLMQGYGLAPYFNDMSKVETFFGHASSVILQEEAALKASYEKTPGMHYYAVCDILLGDVEDEKYETSYEYLCGEDLDWNVLSPLFED